VITHRRRRAAIGAIMGLTAVGIAASAGGTVSVRMRSRAFVCRMAPASDGLYTAAHCTMYPGGVTSISGFDRVPPHSVDRGGRDLAHFAGPAHDVTLRSPVSGEAATIRLAPDVSSRYTFTGVVDGKVYTRDRTPGDYGLWCWVDGQRPRGGMSGSGLYADSDGNLVGVMTNGGPVPVQICASGEAALGVAVP